LEEGVERKERGGSKTVGEEETGCVFAGALQDVDDLEHEFDHFGRGGEAVSATWLPLQLIFWPTVRRRR
jgi:hypothetical protein